MGEISENDEIKSCNGQVVYKGGILVSIMEGRPPLLKNFILRKRRKFYETNRSKVFG